jgi:hypothetical protein
MARKTATITIDAEGRDHGKQFLLREMPASQAEKWAMRVFFGMAKSGLEIPDHIASTGLAGIAAIGLKAIGGLSFDTAEPLLDEMMACVQRIPNPAKPDIVRPLVEDDIEEIGTRLRLRKEVFGLHVDFSKAGALFSSASAPAPAEDSPSQ